MISFQKSKLLMVDPVEKTVEVADLKGSPNSLGRFWGKSEAHPMTMSPFVLAHLNTAVSLPIFIKYRLEMINFDFFFLGFLSTRR